MKDSDIIKIFNRQIKKEYPLYNGVKENCPSYIMKLLFLEDSKLKLTIDDNIKMRDDKYFKDKDLLIGINKDKFTLRQFKKYGQLN